MRSHYKKLGDYIQIVDVRNTEEKKDNLLGVSVTKVFIPSIANTIGTDFTTYKVVKKNQFTYIPDTSRRGDKIGIALMENDTPGLVSQAYTVFEIINTYILDPQYLMIWFRRPEFDRYARFKSHGSAREIFDWEEMCKTELPVPIIEKQREIIAEYNTVQNRITLNNQLIQKLEETAQTIYKHWFVDFEFPDENGKPYKSNGGEMYESELGQIPKGWNIGNLENALTLIISHRGKSKSSMDLFSKSTKHIYPVLSAMNVGKGSIIRRNLIMYADYRTYSNWMLEPLSEGDIILTSEAPMGEFLYLAKKTNFIISQRLFALRTNPIKLSSEFLYYWLQSAISRNDMIGRASGTTVLGIKLSELKKSILLIPSSEVCEKFGFKIKPLLISLEEQRTLNALLSDFSNLLLSILSIL